MAARGTTAAQAATAGFGEGTPQQDSAGTKCAISEFWYCGRILLWQLTLCSCRKAADFPLYYLQSRKSAFCQRLRITFLKKGAKKPQKYLRLMDGTIWFPAFAPPLIKREFISVLMPHLQENVPKMRGQDVETAFRIWYTIHETVRASIYIDWM